MIQKILKNPILLIDIMIESNSTSNRSVWESPIIKDAKQLKVIPVMVRK